MVFYSVTIRSVFNVRSVQARQPTQFFLSRGFRQGVFSRWTHWGFLFCVDYPPGEIVVVFYPEHAPRRSGLLSLVSLPILLYSRSVILSLSPRSTRPIQNAFFSLVAFASSNPLDLRREASRCDWRLGGFYRCSRNCVLTNT